MLYPDAFEPGINFLRRMAGQARIGQQHVAVADALFGEPPRLFHLIGEIRSLQILVLLVREFALNDKAAAHARVSTRSPSAGKRAVPSRVVRIKERLDRL